jgi:hypothetical protein
MPRFVHDIAVSSPHPAHRASPRPDPRLERILRTVILAGLALVLALPAARGYSQWLGWMPLWLVGMPLAAWWSLYRFRLPSRAAAVTQSRPRRRHRAQARRRQRPTLRAA